MKFAVQPQHSLEFKVKASNNNLLIKGMKQKRKVASPKV